MRKEVIFAISIGFILGLVITYGIYTANKALKNKSQQEETVSSPSPAPTQQEQILKILQPEDNLVVNQDEITLKGESNPQAIISILAEDDQQTIFQVEKEGTFSAKIKLISGVNELMVVSISPEGKRAQQDLTIVFSSTKIEP